MNKAQFMKQLEQNLAQLPWEEIRKRIDYYEEMIDDRMEEGMTEAEAVAAMGDPAEIARQILGEMPVGTLVKTRMRPRNGWTVTAIVLVILGAPLWLPLLITAVCLVGSLLLAAVCVVIAFYAVVFGLGLGGIAAFFYSFVLMGEGLGFGLFAMGAGMLLAGLSCLGILAAFLVTRGAIVGSRWLYGKLKKLLIKKGANT